ncbi:DUF6153 family protein [Zhihengliuella salsuginis]|uniref:DUF2946 domain-containing protein n=1 Tax=Zhihengliuella salsuginis TaxID=578222 RepID=A0ABQ3GH07_9MICC|nr:DUF6153 family protein [Zhihengliuella salsuginis]GHD05906.1 hypothetical protein GCM10008096_15280 [Zhihengliuella salsuginis]
MRANLAALISACCIILGLLGMHALAQHGTPSAQHDAAPAAAAPATHGGAHAATGAASSFSHPAPGTEDCADCPQAHAAMAAACLLALIAAVLHLAGPPAFRLRLRAWRRLLPRTPVPLPAPPRPPDLNMLCVCRT